MSGEQGGHAKCESRLSVEVSMNVSTPGRWLSDPTLQSLQATAEFLGKDLIYSNPAKHVIKKKSIFDRKRKSSDETSFFRSVFDCSFRDSGGF